MIQDALIGEEKWLDAWYWFRNAPHQRDAVRKLYHHLAETPGGACLLSRNAEWFQDYQARHKLLHDFMHPDGE